MNPTGRTDLTWVRGPLGYPTTPDWRYWSVKTPTGYRAWYFPAGLPGAGDQLLGEGMSETWARARCATHAEMILP